MQSELPARAAEDPGTGDQAGSSKTALTLTTLPLEIQKGIVKHVSDRGDVPREPRSTRPGPAEVPEALAARLQALSRACQRRDLQQSGILPYPSRLSFVLELSEFQTDVCAPHLCDEFTQLCAVCTDLWLVHVRTGHRREPETDRLEIPFPGRRRAVTKHSIATHGAESQWPRTFHLGCSDRSRSGCLPNAVDHQVIALSPHSL